MREYAYTLQGWLKGINLRDTSNQLRTVGQSISYYSRDYIPIRTITNPLQLNTAPSDALYNGNIAGITYLNKGLRFFDANLNAVSRYRYQYDQLQRLKTASLNTIKMLLMLCPYHTIPMGISYSSIATLHSKMEVMAWTASTIIMVTIIISSIM
ncbi:MAG: hypothetical protein IPL98_13095 [Saprospiraceae bacterium]|nr:hypothetical protein [Saprospiraceae bacterium]